MGFPRQKYLSGLPCPTPGDLHEPGIEPTSLTSPALAGRFFTTRAVVATSPRKQTHSDNADRGVQFITLEGPRQSLLSAKDTDQFL